VAKHLATIPTSSLASPGPAPLACRLPDAGAAARRRLLGERDSRHAECAGYHRQAAHGSREKIFDGSSCLTSRFTSRFTSGL